MSNDTLQLVGQYMKTTAKAWFQYRIDAFMRSLAVFLREATGIIVIYLTLQKFDNLNGWNLYEMMFLYSFLFMTYGILIIFFTGLRDFGDTVRKGEFDRFILRPRGLLFQIIFVNADLSVLNDLSSFMAINSADVLYVSVPFCEKNTLGSIFAGSGTSLYITF